MSLIVKLGLVGVATAVGGVLTLSHLQGSVGSSTYRLEMPSLAGVASIVGLGASAAAGTGGPFDGTFNVRNVHLKGIVGQVDLVAIPQGPVRVQANGKPDTMKALQIRAVGDEVFIGLDSSESQAWFPWNMFNMWGQDRKVQDLHIKVSAPLGTPYDIEDMVGGVTAGDLDAPLRLDGSSIVARFGRVQSARVDIAGSGRVTLGAIKETLDIDVAGSGRFEAASAAAAKIDIAGGGDVLIGPISGGLSGDVAGSGDIRVAEINGAVDLDIAGSGGVTVDRGRAHSFHVEIAGSGDVVFKGEVVDPSIEIMGSGSVKVGCYSGRLKQEIMGSGSFDVLNLCAQQPVPPVPAPPAQPVPPAPPAHP